MTSPYEGFPSLRPSVQTRGGWGWALKNKPNGGAQERHLFLAGFKISLYSSMLLGLYTYTPLRLHTSAPLLLYASTPLLIYTMYYHF